MRKTKARQADPRTRAQPPKGGRAGDEGHLPDGWTVVRLGDVCRKTALTNPEKHPDKPFIYVDVSSVSNEAYRIVETREILGKDGPSRARKVIETDDVIFATVRPTLKRVALIPPELNGQVCSTGYCVVKADKEHLDSAYAYFYLLTEQVTRQVEYLQKGATYPAINDSDLLELSIPLPPLPEQRAIAHALRSVQEAKEARRRELALEREHKAALMHHLFTHGTRGEPAKMTEIGEMPEEWDIVALEQACQKIVDCPHTTPNFQSSGVLVIRNVNVRDGRLVLKPAFYTTEEEYHERIARLEPQEEDILFSREAPIGEACLVPPQTRLSLGQRMMLLRIDPSRLNSGYLVHIFYAPNVKPRMLAMGTGVTAKHLNVQDVRRLKIPLPTLEEQYDIANALYVCDSKIVALEREAAVLDELFRALLEELMTGRVRVAAWMGLPGDEVAGRRKRPP